MSNATSAPRLLGSLGSADGHGVVRMEERLAVAVADLWAAISQPARLSRWLGEVEGDLRPGGEFRAHFFASGWTGSGRVTVCDSPARLAVVTKEEGASAEQVIEATLRADGDGTLLVWETRGMPLEQVAAFGAGVQVHVEDLASYLAGGERCDASARFEQLFPAYQALAD